MMLWASMHTQMEISMLKQLTVVMCCSEEKTKQKVEQVWMSGEIMSTQVFYEKTGSMPANASPQCLN